MKALTIYELNEISLKNSKSVNKCISEINEILSDNWHLKKQNEYYTCIDDRPIWEYSIFLEAKKSFLENGIEIDYYPPHRYFSFKITKP